jgi:hypothetical protein
MASAAVPRGGHVLYFSPMPFAGRVASRVAPILAAGLAAALGPARPAAADEGESALSIDLAFESFAVGDHDGQGGGLGFEYERGLSDAFWLRGAAAGAVYHGSEGEGTTYAGRASVGLTYVIDVLKYVPYLQAGLGGVAVGGGALDTEVHPVAEVGIGLDLLARRGLSYGMFARVGSYLGDSAFLTVGLRTSWRWGFF